MPNSATSSLIFVSRSQSPVDACGWRDVRFVWRDAGPVRACGMVLRRWGFSLFLLLAYLAVFHLWGVLDREGILAVTFVATGILLGFFCRAWKRGYFQNRWDAAAHASVLLDLILEGTLVRYHSGDGFYLCAAAFALVLGGYRATQLRRTRGGWSPPGTAADVLPSGGVLSAPAGGRGPVGRGHGS